MLLAAESVETHQGGHPDGPDVIAHFSVSTGSRVECIKAEVYDEDHRGPLACVVKFDDGSNFTLAVGQIAFSPNDGEAALECLGTKPRLCQIRIRRESKPSR
jgi:hypothetical protein